MDKKSMLESYLRGLAQDASMNFSDEIAGGLESAAGSLGLVPDKTYEQAVQESRDEYNRAKQDNPKSYMAGELTGSAASMLNPATGAAKLAAKGARRLALENMAKNVAGVIGRSNGEELSSSDIGMAVAGGLPISKMISKVPIKAGKGVKIIDESVENNFGKVIQKADPLQEAKLGFKGKVIEKLDPKQEAMLGVKGKVQWEGGGPVPKKSPSIKKEMSEEMDLAKIAEAKQRIQNKKELIDTESKLGGLKKEMAEAEQSLPLKPSLRREYFDEKNKEADQLSKFGEKLKEMLKSNK